MALVTIERTESEVSSEMDAVTDENEGLGELHSISSPARSGNKKLVRQGSVSENFFAVKGAALILPKQTSIAIANLQIVKQFGGELQRHLRAIFHHLRPQDNIKLAVRLESWQDSHRRYLVIVSTQGRQDTDECIIVGCDFATKESTTCTIGLVLPIWCDTSIKLNGDGGFQVVSRVRTHIFKPVSVQAMWSALQSLHRCVDTAVRHNYYEGSLYLTWTGFYQSRIKSERLHINEWEFFDDLFSTKPNYFEVADPDRVPVESLIRSKLKQVMMPMDLDNTTCKEIRVELEKVIDQDLTNYKTYIDNEMLTVLGQMDCASKILDYLFLGSEWNASNIDELTQLGITHILNVTLEIDNFFPGEFQYKNIRLYDVPESDLLPHWNHTWKFINDCRKSGGKCLVHCRMGISRSAATVSAYLMKTNSWSRDVALKYVNDCRSITDPNPGFRAQLLEYEGILVASAQRHNKLFRSRSESSLSEPSTNDDVIMSPRSTVAPSIMIPDEDQTNMRLEESFDFNRHLLDIATLSVPKVHRPKSWSPEEGRTCFVPDNSHNDLSNLSNNNNEHDTNTSHNNRNTSEPGELLISTGSDNERIQRAQQLRKSFTTKRAHLRKQAGLEKELNLDELAQSEDSVFVHDGTSRTTQTPKKRASSPAILTSEPITADDDVIKVAVDVTSLKSRFTEPTTQEKSENEATVKALKASIPVREIVAVIESPIDNSTASSPDDKNPAENFTKGHQKTISLPPVTNVEIPATDPTQARGRSYSETQAQVLSVKKIVTQIESRYSPDGTLEEAEPTVNIQRTMSMPTRRKNLSPSPMFVPVCEVENENPSFYIDESEATVKKLECNNNNNNNNNNNVLSEINCDTEIFTIVEKPLLQTTLSQETLHLIREVGSQYSSLPRSSDDDVSIVTSRSSQSSSHKHKRGLVRNMAREIEKSVRKLAGKSFKKSKKATAATNNVINQLLMGGSPPVDKTPPKETPTPAVRHLVSKFDSSDVRADPHDVIIPFQNTPPSKRGNTQDLFALVTPTPYRSYDNNKGDSPSLSVSSRYKFGNNRVRRSQSERIGLSASPKKYQPRLTAAGIELASIRFKSEPKLNDTDAGNSPRVFKRDSRLVKDMIRSFEKRSGIHRSSSLPSSSHFAFTSPSSTSKTGGLSRSKSTPLLLRGRRRLVPRQ